MLSSFLYRKGGQFEINLSRAEMLATLSAKDNLLWVDLEDPTEFETELLIEIFNFHPLAIEDCINEQSHPKADDYEEYLFLVVHAITMKEQALVTEEMDIFIGKNYVVTFHKGDIKTVEQLREQVRKKQETYMTRGADMLVYHLLDHLVDQYQPALDAYEEKIDHLEEELFNHHAKNFLADVMQVKRDIFHFRKTIAPQRDTLNALTRNTSPMIKPKNVIYFRDVYDHLFRIYGTVEGFHEALAGIMQAYFSYASNRLNEVMKRMTVMATLTMPSVMIAGIYGMNFKSMPELDHPYGYVAALALMAGTSIGMLIWMKWKKWI